MRYLVSDHAVANHAKRVGPTTREAVAEAVARAVPASPRVTAAAWRCVHYGRWRAGLGVPERPATSRFVVDWQTGAVFLIATAPHDPRVGVVVTCYSYREIRSAEVTR